MNSIVDYLSSDSQCGLNQTRWPISQSTGLSGHLHANWFHIANLCTNKRYIWDLNFEISHLLFKFKKGFVNPHMKLAGFSTSNKGRKQCTAALSKNFKELSNCDCNYLDVPFYTRPE